MTQNVDRTSVSTSGNAVTVTVSNVGDILVLYVRQNGSTAYVTAIADTQTNAWTPLLTGSFGTSAQRFTGADGFFYAAFWAVAGATGSNTITLTFAGGTPTTCLLGVMDCVGCSATPIICNIHNNQSSPGTGTNAVTTSGGTGSDSVTSPALLVAFIRSVVNTITAGTTPSPGWTASATGFADDYMFEYQVQSSTGTYDATATLSSNASATSWMIALAAPVVNSAVPIPSCIFVMG